MPDDVLYPNFAQPATKGDVLRAAVYVQSVAIAAAGLAIAAAQGDAKAVQEAFDYFKKENADANQLIKELGGRDDG